MSLGLTPRQLDLLRFVSGFVEAKGYSPSLGEMAAGIGLVGKSGVVRLLEGLEERGAIRRLRYRGRSIDVLITAPVPRGPSGTPLYFVPILRQAQDERKGAS